VTALAPLIESALTSFGMLAKLRLAFGCPKITGAGTALAVGSCGQIRMRLLPVSATAITDPLMLMLLGSDIVDALGVAPLLAVRTVMSACPSTRSAEVADAGKRTTRLQPLSTTHRQRCAAAPQLVMAAPLGNAKQLADEVLAGQADPNVVVAVGPSACSGSK